MPSTHIQQKTCKLYSSKYRFQKLVEGPQELEVSFNPILFHLPLYSLSPLMPGKRTNFRCALDTCQTLVATLQPPPTQSCLQLNSVLVYYASFTEGLSFILLLNCRGKLEIQNFTVSTTKMLPSTRHTGNSVFSLTFNL